MNWLRPLIRRGTGELSEKEARKTNKSWKLTERQKRDVIVQIAVFGMSESDAASHIKEKYGIEFSQKAVSMWLQSRKWAEFFRFEREKYLQNLNEVAIANKRVRLDRQELVYQEAVNEKDRYLALAAMKEGREEMEPKHGFGDTVTVYNNQLNFNAMSDEEFKVKKLEIAKRIKELESKGEENGNGQSQG